MQIAPADSKQSAAGLDPGAVDPTWAPPEGPSDGAGRERHTIPAPLLYGSIVLVLVLLVVAIWGFGGFKKRTDILKTVPPGTLFTTGPYEFRFSEATAQHKKNFDGTLFWQVVMIGEGRTTGNESISPSYMPNSGMFISKDDATQQISPPDSVRMGEAGSDRHHFTPGLTLSPYSVVFKYDDRYSPGHEIRFVVWDVSMAGTSWPAMRKAGTTGPTVTSSTFRSGYCLKISGNQAEKSAASVTALVA